MSITLIGICALLIYFLPYVIANARHHHNSQAILLLNLLLGWTVLGWIAALIWSATDPNPYRNWQVHK